MFRLVAILFCLTLPFNSIAATQVGNATVYIQKALATKQAKPVNFKLSSNLTNTTCSVEDTGNLSGEGCQGSGQIGELQIFGTESQSLSIDVRKEDSHSSLKFEPLLQSTQTPVITSGSTRVLVGGDLVIGGVKEGAHSLTYVITVNYN